MGTLLFYPLISSTDGRWATWRAGETQERRARKSCRSFLGATGLRRHLESCRDPKTRKNPKKAFLTGFIIRPRSCRGETTQTTRRVFFDYSVSFFYYCYLMLDLLKYSEILLQESLKKDKTGSILSMSMRLLIRMESSVPEIPLMKLCRIFCLDIKR